MKGRGVRTITRRDFRPSPPTPHDEDPLRDRRRRRRHREPEARRRSRWSASARSASTSCSTRSPRAGATTTRSPRWPAASPRSTASSTTRRARRSPGDRRPRPARRSAHELLDAIDPDTIEREAAARRVTPEAAGRGAEGRGVRRSTIPTCAGIEGHQTPDRDPDRHDLDRYW